jgi:NADPH2:quinone reductase
MRAIHATDYGSSDVLEPVELSVPEPGAGELRIDVAAAGVNWADIMRRRGEYADAGARNLPYVPGIEAAGTVEALGEGVTGYEVGDRVVAKLTEGYAEKAVTDTDWVIDVPPSLSLAEAAGIPLQFLTAHAVLFGWGGLERGERVLVHAAAGGVGSAAVQLAAEAGAEVFATASTDEKTDLAAALGADHTINYAEREFDAAIAELTDGEGVDLVADGVGGDVFDASMDALAHFGRVVTYGFASSEIPGVEADELMYNNKSAIGFHLGNTMRRDPERIRSIVPEVTRLLEEGPVRVVVGETFPLERAADAHAFVENRDSYGKVLLEP